MADMNDILNPPQETETEQEVVEAEQGTEQREEREEQQVEAGAKETQAAAETKQAETSDVEGIKAAMLAERKKRQELEAEREAERQELDRLRQAATSKQEEEKPFLGEEYEQRFTETEQRLQNALIAQKLDLSESIARDRYEDYDDKLATFKEMMQTNPSLYNQMIAQPNPAGWMYKTASDHAQVQKLREIGDPAAFETSLREKLREELRAELEAEAAEKKRIETEAAIRAKLPKSGFSEERSVGTARPTGKQYTGPKPMGDILK